jgi:hypothetical protein
MKSARTNNKVCRRQAAFTLAEVLASLLFLALVIPAGVEALHVASRVGTVSVRKAAAARVADRVLNESIVMTNWNGGSLSGVAVEGSQEFQWRVSRQNWQVETMQLLTAEVNYSVQGHDYSVTMSTLTDLQTLQTR